MNTSVGSVRLVLVVVSGYELAGRSWLTLFRLVGMLSADIALPIRVVGLALDGLLLLPLPSGTGFSGNWLLFQLVGLDPLECALADDSSGVCVAVSGSCWLGVGVLSFINPSVMTLLKLAILDLEGAGLGSGLDGGNCVCSGGCIDDPVPGLESASRGEVS